ncbi:MAG: universal stress protein [Deltaproteobacteria bacterium HGW-Deltaproteobacteria-12]|jgi:hypothetical protein|nr:MAG: universal stress protein [Deltaproteobacteria bacterium HGW-Deltaproteobacteria-12]
MKNRFIILIDFSPYSEHLIEFAYTWSKSINAEMLLVHNTIVLLLALTPYESKIELTRIANAEALEKLKKYAESVLPKEASFKFLVSERHLVYQLRALLRGPYNNLVFLGLKGTGLLKKIFIGSEAVKVIDRIDNLIVAVPYKPDCCSHETVYVAVHKNYPLNIIEFNKFLNFGKNQISKIVFFSGLTPDDDLYYAEKYLRDLVDLYSDKYHVSYEKYEAESGFQDLKRVIAGKKNEFIVVQKGSKMFLDQMFRKLLINELVYEGNIPLVILP